MDKSIGRLQKLREDSIDRTRGSLDDFFSGKGSQVGIDDDSDSNFNPNPVNLLAQKLVESYRIPSSIAAELITSFANGYSDLNNLVLATSAAHDALADLGYKGKQLTVFLCSQKSWDYNSLGYAFAQEMKRQGLIPRNNDISYMVRSSDILDITGQHPSYPSQEVFLEPHIGDSFDDNGNDNQRCDYDEKYGLPRLDSHVGLSGLTYRDNPQMLRFEDIEDNHHFERAYVPDDSSNPLAAVTALFDACDDSEETPEVADVIRYL